MRATESVPQSRMAAREFLKNSQKLADKGTQKAKDWLGETISTKDMEALQTMLQEIEKLEKPSIAEGIIDTALHHIKVGRVLDGKTLLKKALNDPRVISNAKTYKALKALDSKILKYTLKYGVPSGYLNNE